MIQNVGALKDWSHNIQHHIHGMMWFKDLLSTHAEKLSIKFLTVGVSQGKLFGAL